MSRWQPPTGPPAIRKFTCITGKNERENVSGNKGHSEHVQPKRILAWLSISFVPFIPLPACLPVCLSAAPIVNPNQRPLSRSGIASVLVQQRPLPWVKTSRKKERYCYRGPCLFNGVVCWLYPAPAFRPSLSVVASSPLCSNCFLLPSTSCCPNRRRRHHRASYPRHGWETNMKPAAC